MLATTLTYGLLALTGLLAIPVIVLAVQVFSACLRNAAVPTPLAESRPLLAVLVPAHNEAATIGAACESLQRQLTMGDRLLVVADNCSDDTARAARLAGAEVVERRDPNRRGKDFALEFGVKHLAEHPPAVLVAVDADCSLSPGALDLLARASAASNRPVQAAYIMANRGDAGFRMRIAEFAGIVKNLVRPLGYHRHGLPCMLVGTGMAFPWSLIANATHASGHLVEDMKLGIDLACAGSPPLFCPEAQVHSLFPETAHGFRNQRTRWEHGHLGVILSEAPRLVTTAFRKRNWPLLAMALDLAVPPLALLSLLVAAAVVSSAWLGLLSGQLLPLWVSGGTLALLVSAISIARSRFAQSVLSSRDLAWAPLYALSKVPMYLLFIIRRQKNWVRTVRNGE